MAAGTVTDTRTFAEMNRSGQYVNRVVLAWTSDASGNVNGNASNPINGTILKVEFNPSGAPTDAYDLTLLDTAGVDVLAGQGVNLSGTVASAVIPGVPLKDGTTTSVGPCVVADTLTPTITNAGNAKSGQIILYVR